VLVPVLFVFGKIGDAMRYFTSGKTVQKNECGDGKEMTGLPTGNFVYVYIFFFWGEVKWSEVKFLGTKYNVH